MTWAMTRRRPLRQDGLPPLRRLRAEAAGDLAGPVAQFRRRHAARAEAGDLPARRFDLGITHFDLANNYGPPPGSAEDAFGEILRTDFKGLRDELIISSKAGYGMWPGPYGEWGSRKYLIASCDQSLKRLGLDYVDIFYSHRFDPDTPLEETMGALDHIVRSGRALYAGISSYNSERTREAAAILNDLGTPCLIHQPSYSMLNRWVERDGLKDTLKELGIGSIAFSPLAQGMLTDKYLNGIPDDSRATQGKSLNPKLVNDQRDAEPEQAERDRQDARPDAGADGAGLGAARRRHHLGADRRLAARAGRGLRRRDRQPDFTAAELDEIDKYADEDGINLWARSSEEKGEK